MGLCWRVCPICGAKICGVYWPRNGNCEAEVELRLHLLIEHHKVLDGGRLRDAGFSDFIEITEPYEFEVAGVFPRTVWRVDIHDLVEARSYKVMSLTRELARAAAYRYAAYLAEKYNIPPPVEVRE